MRAERIWKLRGQIKRLRRQGGVRSGELEALARRIGRRPFDRGKEPTWILESPPGAYPLSIPSHRGRDMRRGTVRAILDHLENDLDLIERHEAAEGVNDAED